MRVLVVEDEPKMAAAIRRVLLSERYAVDVASDGMGALALAASGTYDLIVLDRMLPDLDGTEVVGLLRGRGVRVPVLMLTALGTLDQRVNGLDAGADDYLTKPFAFTELLARLRALARRGPPRSHEALGVGDIRLDPLRLQVVVGERAEDLSAREYALLAYLVGEAGTVLTRRQIRRCRVGRGPRCLLQRRRPLRPLSASEAWIPRAPRRAPDGPGRRLRPATGGRSVTTSPRTTDRTRALLRSTGRRLGAFTMIMVAALVIAVGLTTALVATRLMHEGIDRVLEVAVADPLTMNALVEGETHELAARFGIGDTFVLLADATGTALGSSNGAVPPGLPDLSAIEAAGSEIDRRQGTYGGQEVRLLTLPLPPGSGEGEDEGGGGRGPLYLQAGMLLAGHLEQERQLLIAIAIVGTVGTLGAAVVTTLITRRALVPIRRAFETERRFVAVASHELRTPVAVIRASAEILDREGLVDAEGIPFVSDIIGETERMGRLVGDMLELASADAGSVTLEVRPVALGPWFAQVGRRAGIVAESSGVGLALTSEPPADETVVLADADRLDQCVLILVDNAVKHSTSGGSVAVRLSLDRARRAAVLAVTDQGPGVPTSERERIFEPFAQASESSRRSDGVGLGLAIARQLARRQGGDVTVDPSSTRGTTFRLTLPLVGSGRPAIRRRLRASCPSSTPSCSSALASLLAALSRPDRRWR